VHRIFLKQQPQFNALKAASFVHTINLNMFIFAG